MPQLDILTYIPVTIAVVKYTLATFGFFFRSAFVKMAYLHKSRTLVRTHTALFKKLNGGSARL
jgi:hypothetical protein